MREATLIGPAPLILRIVSPSPHLPPQPLILEPERLTDPDHRNEMNELNRSKRVVIEGDFEISESHSNTRPPRIEYVSTAPAVVHMGLRTDGKDGTGLSPENPRDASTPSKLQKIYDERAEVPTKFVYGLGVFQTEGWKRNIRDTAFSNHHHQGAGAGLTILRMVGASTFKDDGRIFGAGNDFHTKTKNFAIRDMTLDCNVVSQPLWTAGIGGNTSALYLYAGSKVRVERCEVINFGTQGREVFPLAVFINITTVFSLVLRRETGLLKVLIWQPAP